MHTYKSLSDNELSFLLTRDDEQAFAEIYDRYFGILFVHASKKLNDAEEARDLVQQLFETLWLKRDRVSPEGNLSSYLYTATINRVMDLFAHQKVENKYIDSLQAFIDQDHVLTDYRVREKEMAKLIEREIDALPPKMREIFVLSRKENKSHKEIAEELGLSELTVKTQVKNALKILKGRLTLLAYLALMLKM